MRGSTPREPRRVRPLDSPRITMRLLALRHGVRPRPLRAAEGAARRALGDRTIGLEVAVIVVVAVALGTAGGILVGQVLLALLGPA